jgi:transposase
MKIRIPVTTLKQRNYVDNICVKWHYPLDSRAKWMPYIGIIIFTLMASDFETNAKHQALQATGTFNPHAAQVKHPLFQQSEFFDPHDLVQLKYETVRAIEVERCPIAQAARQFGLSRPTIYQAQWQFQEHGLEGLLPHKRGPQSPHKLTPEVRQFLREQKAAEPQLGAMELAQRVRQRFQVSLHPRTIEKALHTKAKRGRQI